MMDAAGHGPHCVTISFFIVKVFFFHPVLYYLTFFSNCVIFFSFKNCHMIFVVGGVVT